MAKMIEGDLRIPKMYNFIFTIIFDFRPKVDGVILPSPLNLIFGMDNHIRCRSVIGYMDLTFDVTKCHFKSKRFSARYLKVV